MLKFSIITCSLIVLVALSGCTEAPPETIKLDAAPAADHATDSTTLSMEPIDPNPEEEMETQEYNQLSEFEQYVILEKGTERAFVGEYTDLEDTGTYVCKQCNAPLYKSDHKFHSGCGWPAFDDEIKDAVRA